ncbi:MAG: ATP-binding protein [Pseudomonadota bacterium]
MTTFLDEALGKAGSGRNLEQTAEPLIRAIESVPGSGRVAVFLNEDSDPPRFVSGPSFETGEVQALNALVSSSAEAGDRIEPKEAVLPVGDEAPNRVRLFPLSVPSERPAAILVTVRDPINDDKHSVFDSFMDQIVQLAGIVVEDRRLRSKMAEQQSVLEALVGAAPDAIIRIDRSGTILDYMGSAPRMFGWSREEILDKPLSTLMPDPHASRHDDYIDAFLATGERKLPDFGRRLQAKHKSGDTFPIEIALSQLPGVSDVEFIGIIRDISVRVEREGELAAMRDALDAAGVQSALGELAATIAHELNQPLTAIANYMDALGLRLETPTQENIDVAADLSRKAASQARLGGEIIRRTRRMALHSESEMAMEDVHAVVGEALSLMSKTPAVVDVVFELRKEGGSDLVLIDKVQIQQVVINLVSNALRAMEGCQEQVLTVISRQTDDSVELVVSDTGPGVPDEDKQKIFDRFFRRSESGMGLGLSVVRRIAIAHGGDIKLSDAPGGGAEFTLTLPRRVL